MLGKAVSSLSSVLSICASSVAFVLIVGYVPDQSELLCAFIGILGFIAIHVHSRLFRRVQTTNHSKWNAVSTNVMSRAASSCMPASAATEVIPPEQPQGEQDTQQVQDGEGCDEESCGAAEDEETQDEDDAYDALLDDCEACCIGSLDFVLLVEHWASRQGVCTSAPADGLLPMNAWRVLALHFLQASATAGLPLYAELRERAAEIVSSSELVRDGADVISRSCPGGPPLDPVELFRQFVLFYSIEFQWRTQTVSLYRRSTRAVSSPPRRRLTPSASRPQQGLSKFSCPIIEDPFSRANLAQAMTAESFEQTHSELYHEHIQCNCCSKGPNADNYLDSEDGMQCLDGSPTSCRMPMGGISLQGSGISGDQTRSEELVTSSAVEEQILREGIEVVANRQLSDDQLLRLLPGVLEHLRRRRSIGLLSWTNVMTLYLLFPQSGIL